MAPGLTGYKHISWPCKSGSEGDIWIIKIAKYLNHKIPKAESAMVPLFCIIDTFAFLPSIQLLYSGQ